MAKTPNKKGAIEFAPDAWERFERAVKVVAKSPPLPKKSTKKSAMKKKRA